MGQKFLCELYFNVLETIFQCTGSIVIDVFFAINIVCFFALS